jgi:hypothetical protein
MRRLPLILFIAHSALILALGACIYASLRAGYQESVQLWGLAAMVDLPVVPALAALETFARPLLESNGELVWWVLYPSTVHIVLGGLLWAFAGWGIARLSAHYGLTSRCS